MTTAFPEHRRYLSIPPSGTRVMFIAPEYGPSCPEYGPLIQIAAKEVVLIGVVNCVAYMLHNDKVIEYTYNGFELPLFKLPDTSDLVYEAIDGVLSDYTDCAIPHNIRSNIAEKCARAVVATLNLSTKG